MTKAPRLLWSPIHRHMRRALRARSVCSMERSRSVLPPRRLLDTGGCDETSRFPRRFAHSRQGPRVLAGLDIGAWGRAGCLSVVAGVCALLLAVQRA